MAKTKSKIKGGEVTEVMQKELVSALNCVKPAVLPEQTFLPILSHFCFKDGYVFGYDDSCSIACAYGGTQLDGYSIPINVYDFLKSTTSTKIKVETGAKELGFKVGRAALKFGTFTESDFLFIPPPIKVQAKGKAVEEFVLTDNAIKGIGLCISNISSEALIPNQKGVTFVISKGKLIMYSTDNVSVSRYETKVSKKVSDATFIVSKKFAQLLLDTFKTDKGCEFFLTKKEVWVTDGTVTIYSKLIPTEGMRDIEKEIFSTYNTKDKQMHEVCAKLVLVLDRALAVLGVNKKYTQDVVVTIKQDKMVVSLPDASEGVTFSGKFSEYVRISSKKTKEAKFMFSASMFKRACSLTESLCIHDDGVMSFSDGSSFNHVLSPVGR